MCSYLDQVGSTYYFRRAVPKDLVGHFMTKSGRPRTEWKFSLGTKERETAKRLLRPHEIETDTLIDNVRLDVQRGIDQNADEEAAKAYSACPREQEEAEALAAVEEARRARYEARKEYRVAARQRILLSTAELSPQEAAWRDLVREQGQELERLQEAAAGQRAANAVLQAERAGGSAELGLLDLFDRYASSGAANPNTARRWRRRVEGLIEHLGHDDAAAVTRADLNGWTAALVNSGLSKKTIVDGYLPAVRAAFSVAFEDGAIPVNPASGLKVRAPKPVKLRERDLTDDEAATILRATLVPPPQRLSPDHALARRWVPWLCAYTGARVGEITQLRAIDIKEEGGIWFIHITPEADGGVKTNEARKVPLHSHLIEQGITDLAGADERPLFFPEGVGNAINPGSKIRAAHLAKWVRSLGITAPQPFHGWRHRFKTLTRAAEVPEYLADKLQGHASPTQSRNYGDALPIATLRDAIEKLPRYEIGPSPVIGNNPDTQGEPQGYRV